MAQGDYTLLRLANPRVLPTLQAQGRRLFWTLRGVDLGELGWVGVVGDLGPVERVSEDFGGVPVLSCSVNTFVETLLIQCAMEGKTRQTLYFDPDDAAKRSAGNHGEHELDYNEAGWSVRGEPLPSENRAELARWTAKADFVVDDWEFVALAVLGQGSATARPAKRATASTRRRR